MRKEILEVPAACFKSVIRVDERHVDHQAHLSKSLAERFRRHLVELSRSSGQTGRPMQVHSDGALHVGNHGAKSDSVPRPVFDVDLGSDPLREEKQQATVVKSLHRRRHVAKMDWQGFPSHATQNG